MGEIREAAVFHHPTLKRLIPFLPLLALALLAIWSPLRYGIPVDFDAPNHFYRFVELDWHVRHGDLYPRWFADVYFGFGGPILNFYAPLSYYLLVAIRVLVGSFGLAYLIGFGLSLAVASLGMYCWARDQFASPLAGWVAAAAYGLSPYFYYTMFKRGAYPEMWGLALAPWLFWALRRWIGQPSQSTRLTFTILCAVLLLTHNLSTLLFAPLLLIYGLSELWPAYRSTRGRVEALSHLGLYGGHALLLGAILVVPFLFEAADVQLQRAETVDYHNSFMTWGEMFSAPLPFDPYYIDYPTPHSLAWPQALLGLAAVSFLFAKRPDGRQQKVLVMVAAAQLLILMFLMHSLSLPLWEAFPLARLIQSPWRLVGPATLLLAWLSGAGVMAMPGERRRLILALAAGASIFFFSLTWTYGQALGFYPDSATPLDLNQFERTHLASVGTTGTQEFLPRWVTKLPDQETLAGAYEQNPIPFRLAPPPPDVALVSQEQTLSSTAIAYESPQAFTATVYQFFFPGWTATLDDVSVPIQPSEPDGLITVAVPAGSHHLRVFRQLTLPQMIGTLISLAALGLLFVPWPMPARTAQAVVEVGPALGVRPALALTSLALGLLVLRIAIFDRLDTPFRHTEWNSIPNRLSVKFGDQLELLGFTYPGGAALVSGGALDVRIYWLALQALTTRYSTSVQLVDAYGNRFGQSDNYSPAGIPTVWWPPNKYARDEHRLSSLVGTPPGEYHVHVNVYSGEAGSPYTPLALAGNTGLEYDLGTVTVKPAVPGPSGPLQLVSHTFAAEAATVGDRLAFTLVWNSGDDPLPPLTARFALTDGTGRALFARDFAPAGPEYPTDQWSPNQQVLFPYSLILPPDLPAGPAQATAQLVDADGTALTPAYRLGVINISVPQRSFAIPAMAQRVNYDFKGAIRLLGYDIADDGITLYWQALRPVSVPLTVFVHRFAPDGRFETGHDSPPPRLTTSWLPGEVVVDSHPIAVADHFEIGLYESATGDRFGEPFRVNP